MSEPTALFYPELLDRYELIINRRLSYIDTTEQPDKTELSHILKLIDILRTDETQSITKKHRWLGFIQGVLVFRGLTTVDRERDFTRNIFNGA